MKKIYLLLPLIFWIPQILFTLNSMNQIRYEELAESVRNPYWFQNGYMYDGISGSMAWYGILTIVYNIFGFSLFTAKFVRIAIHLVSLFCLAIVLKKYLGEKLAWMSFIVIGLSPTVLFFNITQTIGIDLEFLPICLYLLSKIDFKKDNMFFQILFWIIMMIAWLCYSTFVFYLPAFALIYLWLLFSKKPHIRYVFKNLLISIISFLLPLVTIFLYIKNKQVLIFDPLTNSGLFRGGVKSGIDLSVLWPSIQVTLSDFFRLGNSYYFDLKNVDFSGYPTVTVITVFLLSFFVFFRLKKLRIVLAAVYLTVILSMFLGHSMGSSEFAGMRRATPILAGFYILYAITWIYLLKIQKVKFLKYIVFFIMLILPVHHIFIYPANLTFIKEKSPYRDTTWFEIASSPEKSLETLVGRVQKEDLKLVCKNPCRYQEVYAGVAGFCLWNRLECHKILGYEQNSGKMVPLSIEYFKTH